MRELLKKEQLVTVVPQDFKLSNKGKITDVSMEGFKMELKYKPDGLIKNHICDFYSLTDNGYLYFESYIQNLENNVVSVANPVKHKFLQRRKYTRIAYFEKLELTCNNKTHEVKALDLSAGGMKVKTADSVDIELEYKVTLKLSDDQIINSNFQIIRISREEDGMYTLSGRFTNLNNIDKMTLVQYCMKKNMENFNK